MVGKEGGKEFGRNDVVLICFECLLLQSSAQGSRAGINLPSSTVDPPRTNPTGVYIYASLTSGGYKSRVSINLCMVKASVNGEGV